MQAQHVLADLGLDGAEVMRLLRLLNLSAQQTGKILLLVALGSLLASRRRCKLLEGASCCAGGLCLLTEYLAILEDGGGQ